MNRKNGFLTFCFAFGPGCGQMYLGYMKRGVSLLFWFIAVIALGAMLNLGAVMAFAIIIWVYSFFDALNIRALTPEQQAHFADDYIPSQKWMAENRIHLREGRGAKLIGWGLIAVGALTLYNNFVHRLVWNLAARFPFVNTLYYALPRLLLGVAILILGVWVLRRTTKPTPQSYEEEDMVQYLGHTTLSELEKDVDAE